MNAAKRQSIKQKVQTLLKKGRQKAEKNYGEPEERMEYYAFFEAQQYVVREAYVEHDDESLQTYFDSELPDNAVFARFETSELKRLKSRSLATRSKAVARIAATVRSEWGMATQLTMLHPKTVKALLSALRAESGEDTQIDLLRILGQLFVRGFAWAEIFAAIEPSFDSKSTSVRETAIIVTQHMPFDERRWQRVFPLLKKCRKASLFRAFKSHCENVPPKQRLDILEVLLAKHESIRGSKRAIVGAMCSLITTPQLAREFDRRVDWSDESFRDDINIWLQLDRNPLVKKLASRHQSS